MSIGHRARTGPPDTATSEVDRGATLLLAVMSMLTLLLFGAFAVDLGSAWSQRRQNQGAIDPGTVAGALQTRGVDAATAIAAADAEIMRITYSSIDPDMTPAQWQAEWAACTDPDKGTEYTVTGSSDCISYTSNLQKIRARTPGVDTPTSFAGVIGIDTLTTDAAAEVLIALRGSGAILPFGLPGNTAGDTEICLKTGANPKDVAPCDGPDTGNFQFLDVTEFGNEALQSTTLCSGDSTGRIGRNIARGVDHLIGVAPAAGAPFRTDVDGCMSGNFSYEPYSLTTQTGNVFPALDAGFIDGIGGYPGRLTLSSDTITQGGKTFDDKPLWEYLNGDGQTLCGVITTHDEMAVCLASMSGDTMYFLDSLTDSPRFAWVPLFYGTNLGTGNTTLNVDEFRPVYLQTTLWSCSASACDASHDPGEGITGTIQSNDSLIAVSALQLPVDNLPASADASFFGRGGAALYALTR
jgi:Flp pilus assembly protein TadG